jgi:hypothetical protein
LLNLQALKQHQNSHCSHPKWHQNSTKTTLQQKMPPKWHQSISQNGTRVTTAIFTISQNGTKTT